MTEEQPQKSIAPLHECVRMCVEQYFADLDGQAPVALYERVMQEVEKPLLEVVMRENNGNKLKAAKVLGINRNTLRKKLNRYSIG